MTSAAIRPKALLALMIGAPIVLKLNEHVRVDLIYAKLKGNGRVYVDLFGLVVFLLPRHWLVGLPFLSLFHQGACFRRNVPECGRFDPLAGYPGTAAGLCHDVATRLFGNHQTCGVFAGQI